MSANIKSLKTRINSINNTAHLTHAMELVASSKIKRATMALNNANEYLDAIEYVSNILLSYPECKTSEYMKENDSKKDCIIAIAGDRGLAGGYNINIYKLLSEYTESDIIPIGKKICERQNQKITLCETFTSENAHDLISKLCKEYKEGKYRRIGIISTKYINLMKQTPNINWLLPLKSTKVKSSGTILFEPNAESVFNYIVPELLTAKLVSSIKESFLSEVVSRRMAMNNASNNADKMINELKLQYNQARQSSITQELTEIIGGSSQ